MEAKELVRLGVNRVHRERLGEEIDAFQAAVPGAKSTRDILEHLDKYARGGGWLQRAATKELVGTMARNPRCEAKGPQIDFESIDEILIFGHMRDELVLLSHSSVSSLFAAIVIKLRVYLLGLVSLEPRVACRPRMIVDSG